jgi:hypothetical protein
MAYCTNTDVKVYTGTAISDADLTTMITDADGIIDAFLKARQLTAADAVVAKQASILYVRAAAAERLAFTGEAPTSWSSGDYSQSGATDFLSLSKELTLKAEKVLKDYVGKCRAGSSESDVKRSDAVMPEFKLDQTDDPVIYDASLDDEEDDS